MLANKCLSRTHQGNRERREQFVCIMGPEVERRDGDSQKNDSEGMASSISGSFQAFALRIMLISCSSLMLLIMDISSHPSPQIHVIPKKKKKKRKEIERLISTSIPTKPPLRTRLPRPRKPQHPPDRLNPILHRIAAMAPSRSAFAYTGFQRAHSWRPLPVVLPALHERRDQREQVDRH